MKNVFICIEGNIGAGKTTLAKILAKELNGSLLLEKFEENPHLKKFYKNPKLNALQTELWFLTERCGQIKKFFSSLSLRRGKEGEAVISDYHISKCTVFAKTNLTKKDFQIYKNHYVAILPHLPKPDLCIFLQQNVAQLKSNIQKRGRAYEKKISLDYLNKIEKGYKSLLQKKWNMNSIIIDCSRTDFSRKKDLKRVISLVKSTIGY